MFCENPNLDFSAQQKLGQILLDSMLSSVRESHPYIQGILINPDELVFEERIRMNCVYCGRYNDNWKCPPKLPELDYKKMIAEFDYAAFIYLRLPISDGNSIEARIESSVKLHYALLEFEKYLWNRNNATSVSFLGGSCKLCKNGCGKEKCSNPYLSRAPLEATGLNILKSAEKYGIHITFPPRDMILRIGMILW